MDVTTQMEERPIEAEVEKAAEGRSEDPAPEVVRPRAHPDLSRAQLGYLRSVLGISGD